MMSVTPVVTFRPMNFASVVVPGVHARGLTGTLGIANANTKFGDVLADQTVVDVDTSTFCAPMPLAVGMNVNESNVEVAFVPLANCGVAEQGTELVAAAVTFAL